MARPAGADEIVACFQCGCGYTCGTVAALQLHLDLALSSDCQPLPEQPWDDASHLSTALLQLGRLEVLEDPNERLMLAARAGDAAEVQQLLSSGGAEMSEAILDAAVRGGHVAATSALLLHCRSRRPQYDRPLDGVNSVANVLNWAAAGYSGLAGPSVIAMIVKVIDHQVSTSSVAWRPPSRSNVPQARRRPHTRAPTQERHLDALRKGPLPSRDGAERAGTVHAMSHHPGAAVAAEAGPTASAAAAGAAAGAVAELPTAAVTAQKTAAAAVTAMPGVCAADAGAAAGHLTPVDLPPSNGP